MQSKLDSLRVWKQFATSGCLKSSSTKKLNLSGSQGKSLGAAIPKIDSLNLTWLTRISIITESVSPSVDYMTLSKLQNVVRIQISLDRGIRWEFSNRTLAAWSCDAAETGAFGNLRLMFIECCAITDDALQHLHKFPLLERFFVHDCSFSRVARELGPQLGWNAIEKFVLQQILERCTADFM